MGGMNEQYKAILRKAAESEAEFAATGEHYKAALELAASGLVIAEIPGDGKLHSGVVVHGITVAGRDYLDRTARFVARTALSMLLSVSSGLLGVIIARYVPVRERVAFLEREPASEQREAGDAQRKVLWIAENAHADGIENGEQREDPAAAHDQHGKALAFDVAGKHPGEKGRSEREGEDDGPKRGGPDDTAADAVANAIPYPPET